MIEAMCLYEVDTVRGADLLDYEHSDKFNVSVSYTVSPKEHLVLYAKVDPALKDSAIVREVLQWSLEVLATRPAKSDTAPDPNTGYRPRFHGFHTHAAVSSSQGPCADPLHHPSCSSFGDGPDECTGTSAPFKCVHQDPF